MAIIEYNIPTRQEVMAMNPEQKEHHRKMLIKLRDQRQKEKHGSRYKYQKKAIARYEKSEKGKEGRKLSRIANKEKKLSAKELIDAGSDPNLSILERLRVIEEIVDILDK